MNMNTGLINLINLNSREKIDQTIKQTRTEYEGLMTQ